MSNWVQLYDPVFAWDCSSFMGDPILACWHRHWTGLDWTGLDWTGLDWTGLALDWHWTGTGTGNSVLLVPAPVEGLLSYY